MIENKTKSEIIPFISIWFAYILFSLQKKAKFKVVQNFTLYLTL